jgi:hypothetical protein
MSVPARIGRKAASTFLGEPGLLAFAAVNAAARRAIIEGRLAHRTCGIGGEAGNLDGGGGKVRRDLDQPHGFLGDHQNMGRLREGDRADERLQVKAVGDLDQGAEPVGETKRADGIWGREDRQAVGLQPPIVIIVGQIVQFLAKQLDAPLVRSRAPQLLDGILRQVRQLDPGATNVLGYRRGRKVDRDAGIGPHLAQCCQIPRRGKIEMKHGRLLSSAKADRA